MKNKLILIKLFLIIILLVSCLFNCENRLVNFIMPEKEQEINTFYSIYLSDDDCGIATANTVSAEQGELITIFAIPDNGYRFNEWQVISGDLIINKKNESLTTFEMPGNDVRIIALFELIQPDTSYLILSPPFTFDSFVYNEVPPKAEIITITNTGTTDATVTDIFVKETHTGSLILGIETDTIVIIEPGESKDFTIRPSTGLNAGSYSANIIAMYDNSETAKTAVDFYIIKAQGSRVTVPTVDIVRLNNIVFNASSLINDTGQEIEYAISNSSDGTGLSEWQSDRIFGSLEYNKGYYIYARSASNNNYFQGVILSVSEEIFIPLVYEPVLEFGYTGNMQEYTLGPGIYMLEVWGAQGGGNGAKGGYSTGYITLRSLTNIYIYIGGMGVKGLGNVGGFNGGGGTYLNSVSHGGGGASDIRITEDSLYSRVLVAGGGGGIGQDYDPEDYTGVGGGTSGGKGYSNVHFSGGSYSPPAGGNQISGGERSIGRLDGQTDGSFGQGGIGFGNWGGGAGGGWYGGGGGLHWSGAGGSGWVYTAETFSVWEAGNPTDTEQWLLDSRYYLTNAGTIAGNQEFKAPDGTTETGHSGNGFARITFIAPVESE